MPDTDPNPKGDRNPERDDVTRRTWLAAERTWLAWWRTGLAAAAVALAVGRLLPALAHGARWPFRLLGIGYGALAIGVVVMGALRQRRTTDALRRGGFDELPRSLVVVLTVAVAILALATIAVIAVSF
jgi:putative membrane protein